MGDGSGPCCIVIWAKDWMVSKAVKYSLVAMFCNLHPASNFQRRFAMFRDVMRVKTSAREGSREVYILREVS